MKNYLSLFLPLLFLSCTQKENTDLLSTLMQERGGIVSRVFKQADKHRVQILYTQIDRDSANHPHFTSYAFRVNSDEYFYPASTVKFPAAVLSLEKLKQLEIQGLDLNASLQIDSVFRGQSAVYGDRSSKDHQASIGHYIKKILLVSDNDAFNRLYEFLGQESINETLWKRGYEGTRIIHRLSIFLSQEENQHTNPMRFYAGKELIYEQAEATSGLSFDKVTPVNLGKGEMSGGKLIEGPKNFSIKNAFPIQDQQQLLKSVLFSNSVMGGDGFDLTESDRKFLWKYMSMLPNESDYPSYPDSIYYDGYVKFFMFGDTKDPIPPQIRIFNKVGNAYGFLTDNAYVVDFDRGIEFLLTATVYVNENKIFNDNNYEYDEIGYPFMADLGRMIYDYEVKRQKQVKPELSEFRFIYE